MTVTMTRIAPRLAAAVLACTVALSATAALAEDATWTADPGHSSAQFTVTHLVIAKVQGTIPIKSATLTIPSGSNIPSAIDAVLDPSNLDSKNANRDKDLKSPNFFDVDKFPAITFKSTKVTPGPNNTFSAQGNLTIHGVTKPVVIAGEYSGQITDGRGRKHNGYTATLQIKRDDFGMTFDPPVAGPLLAGHDVTIDLAVEAILGGR